MPEISENRPPYVEFKRVSVEDRAATIAAGVYKTKEVDYIVLVPHGSEGKIRVEKEYALWLHGVEPHTSALPFEQGPSRFPREWVEKIKAAYSAWKKGEDLAIEGTPLKNWPVCSPGMAKIFNDLHVYSVEELAVASDDLLERVGMGAIPLRQRARDWVAAAGGETAKLTARLEVSEQANKDKDVRIASLEEQLKLLQGQVALLATQVAEKAQEA